MQVRLEVNALSKAFSQRSEERKSSHTAHKMAMGTFALEAAVDAGAPFKAEMNVLAAGAGADPLVSVALASILEEVASQVRFPGQLPVVLFPLSPHPLGRTEGKPFFCAFFPR
jgi:Mitochondrial inner membrane protein